MKLFTWRKKYEELEKRVRAIDLAFEIASGRVPGQRPDVTFTDVVRDCFLPEKVMCFLNEGVLHVHPSVHKYYAILVKEKAE